MKRVVAVVFVICTVLALLLLAGAGWYGKSRVNLNVGCPFDGGVCGLSARA